jgi:proline iminopeptidase
VSGLLLRSTFIASEEAIDHFFQGAAAEEPQAWAAFAATAPEHQRHALLTYLAQRLTTVDTEPQRNEARRCALAWRQWERALGRSRGAVGGLRVERRLAGGDGTTACAAPDAEPPETAEDHDALAARYRVQSHYLMHQCFLEEPLPTLCRRVPHVPTLLLHGRDDRVCRPDGALALKSALPYALLHVIDGAGHDPTHAGMRSAMEGALSCFAEHGTFAGTPLETTAS